MNFSELVINSGYLHRPLHADDEFLFENSLMKELLNTPVTKSEKLDLNKSVHTGCGKMEISIDDNTILLTAPAAFERWGENQPPDGDYCNFGSSGITLEPQNHDMREYQRICFEAYAEPCGVRTPHMNVGLVNDGEIKVPDAFNRTGNSMFQLYYGKWTPFVWEIGELPRDNVTSISIRMSVNGYDSTVFSDYAIRLRNIRIEQVEYSEQPKGWNCSQAISYSYSGYKKNGKKTAITQMPCKDFSLTDLQTGKTHKLTANKVLYRNTEMYLLDFSDITEIGRYTLTVNTNQVEISISENPFDECRWKLLNFIYSERCGCPVPEKHGFCHGDIVAEHVFIEDSKKTPIKISYNGGWHDAGDVSQQTLQSGEITMALYQLAGKSEDKILSERLYEEAEWGIEFILKTRFGDGYRATSAGASRWTKGYIGDMDDIYARVHNHSFENFLLSAIEADASKYEKNRDEALSDRLYNVAYEDFIFADSRFKSHGMELPSMFEHSHNSSLSLYYAVAVYSACKLLSIKYEQGVFDTMLDYLSKLLLCQETGARGLPISGWFYRDDTHKHAVHFNHQSREHLFAYALVETAKLLNQHNNCMLEQVNNAIMLLSGYYKKLYEYSSPYGMIGAGVYFEDEALDEDTFKLLHLLTDYNSEKDNYIKQVRNGEKIDQGVYIRAFPVWFSFRGNGAVVLSSGAGIRILAHYLDDKDLHAIADEQLYFFTGKNPFCQSLIYGEGRRYSALYAALAGEAVGGMPVGVETDGNEDEPFWPSANNATYKEIWTSTAVRFMMGM